MARNNPKKLRVKAAKVDAKKAAKKHVARKAAKAGKARGR